jgi:hypothetical protein
VRIETRWRTTCVATREKNKKPPNKEKSEIPVDISDRLIETRLSRHFGITSGLLVTG